MRVFPTVQVEMISWEHKGWPQANIVVYDSVGVTLGNPNIRNVVFNGTCEVFTVDLRDQSRDILIPKGFHARRVRLLGSKDSEVRYSTLICPFAPPTDLWHLLQLQSVQDTVMVMEEVALPQANTPYIYRYRDGTQKGPFMLEMTDVDIPATPDMPDAPAVDGWTLHGVYRADTIHTRTADGAYIYEMDKEEGNHFVRIGEDRVVNPFGAYFMSAADGHQVYAMATKEELASVSDRLNRVPLCIECGRGRLTASVGKAMRVGIYTLGGQLVASLHLKAGEVHEVALHEGIYLVNGHRVTIR